MKKITFTITNHTYPIIIDKNILNTLQDFFNFNNYSHFFIITDENVAPHFLATLIKQLPKETAFLILPAGEQTKQIKTVETIWTAMKENGLDRKSLVINLGGGVIGDMGAFAASTYMRGLHFLQIPTTLLSQIDSSIGGKTGIDFADVKNLVGTFSQPIGVLIDTQTLKTLPKREFISGFAEMIKHGLIADKTYFEKITNKNSLDFSDEELIALIARSCEIKKQIVEDDEKEKGKRKLLNFGHTIGHALEALSLETTKPLLHGEAVSIGMVAEAKIAHHKKLLSENEVTIIENKLQLIGLPTTYPKVEKKKFFEKIKLDKKNENGKNNFTLLTQIGKAKYNQVISDEFLAQTLDFIK